MLPDRDWETLNKGTGDCEDIVILILGISYKMFNEKGYFIYGDKGDIDYGHIFCEINNKEYYNAKNFEAKLKIDFDLIHMSMKR